MHRDGNADHVARVRLRVEPVDSARPFRYCRIALAKAEDYSNMLPATHSLRFARLPAIDSGDHTESDPTNHGGRPRANG